MFLLLLREPSPDNGAPSVPKLNGAIAFDTRGSGDLARLFVFAAMLESQVIRQFCLKHVCLAAWSKSCFTLLSV
jgi:hypothetical protein